MQCEKDLTECEQGAGSLKNQQTYIANLGHKKEYVCTDEEEKIVEVKPECPEKDHQTCTKELTENMADKTIMKSFLWSCCLARELETIKPR